MLLKDFLEGIEDKRTALFFVGDLLYGNYVVESDTKELIEQGNKFYGIDYCTFIEKLGAKTVPTELLKWYDRHICNNLGVSYITVIQYFTQKAAKGLLLALLEGTTQIRNEQLYLCYGSGQYEKFDKVLPLKHIDEIIKYYEEYWDESSDIARQDVEKLLELIKD